MLAVLEGFSPTAYKDIVGVPTIGFGETKGVLMGHRTTPERSLVHLLSRIEDEYGRGLKKCIKVPLYQHEYDAYLALSYNIGVRAFCNSTVVKRLNEEKYEEACTAIKLFNRAGGKKVQGLVNAREKGYKRCIGQNA